MLLFMAYPPPSSSIGSSSSKALPVSSTTAAAATNNAAMTTVTTTGATTAATNTCQERTGLNHDASSPLQQQSPDMSLINDASSNEEDDEEARDQNGFRRGLRRGRQSRDKNTVATVADDDDSVERSGCCSDQLPRLKSKASSNNNNKEQQQQNDQLVGINPAEEKDHEQQQQRHRPTFFQQMEDVPRVYIEKLYENTVDGPCQVTLCEVKHMDLFMNCQQPFSFLGLGRMGNPLEATANNATNDSPTCSYHMDDDLPLPGAYTLPQNCEYCGGSDTKECDNKCARPELYFQKKRPPFAPPDPTLWDPVTDHAIEKNKVIVVATFTGMDESRMSRKNSKGSVRREWV